MERLAVAQPEECNPAHAATANNVHLRSTEGRPRAYAKAVGGSVAVAAHYLLTGPDICTNVQKSRAESKCDDAKSQHAGSHPERGRTAVLDARLQCRVDPRHRAGSRRQSGQHHLSFQEQGRLAARNLQAPLRADEQAPHRVAGGGKARARRSGPAGSDRAGLCAAGVFIEQRPCRRRRALHAAARGDVGRRQRRGGAHHRRDLRRHHQRLHRGDRGKPAASAADDDRVAVAVSARRALLYPRQPGARDAAVARRSRRRRHGGSDRAARRGDGRLVAGVRRR